MMYRFYCNKCGKIFDIDIDCSINATTLSDIDISGNIEYTAKCPICNNETHMIITSKEYKIIKTLVENKISPSYIHTEHEDITIHRLDIGTKRFITETPITISVYFIKNKKLSYKENKILCKLFKNSKIKLAYINKLNKYNIYLLTIQDVDGGQ